MTQRDVPPVPALSDVPARITAFLGRTGLSTPEATIRPMTGDASDRRYFRVTDTDGRSFVLAVHPGPIETASMPFVEVGRLFARMPVPVPHLLAHDDALGILALDDLGDATLQSRLERATPGERLELYREAVRLIRTIQARGAALASRTLTPYRLAFDVEKLTYELDFFTTHFLGACRGVPLTPELRDALAAEWRELAGELAAEPRVLCHRDYHSRNLMWHDGRLYIIDFQDARLGPDTYDLVSLLRDAYVEVPEAEAQALIDDFLASDGTAAPPGTAAEFLRRFDVMTVQRSLKALGTFGFQATSRGNPSYLPYVPRTVAVVRRALQRHPRFARLDQLLGSRLGAEP